jgi:hypothetical protein
VRRRTFRLSPGPRSAELADRVTVIPPVGFIVLAATEEVEDGVG